MKPRFFRSAQEFGRWLARSHATHWVVSAKQEETRARRLEQLIAPSAEGRKLRQFTPLDQRDR